VPRNVWLEQAKNATGERAGEGRSGDDARRGCVSRRIGAAAEELCAVLADPCRHPGLDGSGMLRYALIVGTISGAGDEFVVRMHNNKMGEYEITNHVVEYEQDRRIAREPVLSAAPRAGRRRDRGPWRARVGLPTRTGGPDDHGRDRDL